MNEYSRIGLLKAYVERYEFACANCQALNLAYYSTPNSDTSGAHCGNCEALVWFNPRLSGLLAEQYDTARDGDYRTWHIGKIMQFLAALPPCPQCSAQSFNEFRTAVASEPIRCFSCDTPYTAEFRRTTLKHQDEEIWWLNKAP